jgi:hypothetical protein
MTKTKYYDLQMDDPQDDYDVDVVNANLKKIDEQMKTRENATDALQEPEFTVAAKRENIASKEKMPKILGKIAKFFADLKTVAFSGKYNDLDGKPAIVNNNTTTEPGSALDARQANPNIEGTMAASIAQINSNLNTNMLDISYIPKTFKLFNDVPLTTGIHVYCVTGYGDPVADSPYPNLDGWWNIIQFGVDGNGSLFRLTQIASQVFQAEFGFKGKDELWIRSRHDAIWSNWVKL